jgi:predicted lactoylglutathione lyase
LFGKQDDRRAGWETNAMERMIFVNLPVADLARSIAFYEAVGGAADPHFRSDDAQMMRISDTICVMLLTHARFAGFAPTRTIANAHEVAQVLLCLSAASREDVDATVARAVAAGGEGDPSPVDEYGYMYGRSFVDPDGHMWGINWMDFAAAVALHEQAQAMPEQA